MRILTLALILAAPLLRAQSLGEPRPMTNAEVLYYTGAEGMWHQPTAGDLRLCGIPLRFDASRGWVIRHAGQEVGRVAKLPGTVDLKLPKGAAVRTYRLRLRVDAQGRLQVASAMAVRCTTEQASAWVVDVDLDGRFLERGEDALLHDDSGTAGPYAGEIWFLRLGLRVVEDKKPGLKRIMDADTKVGAALCVLNHYRQVTGFSTVREDTTLSKGCALHASYVEKNRHLKFNWHSEDPNNPHYTRAGAWVAPRSMFSFDGTYTDGVVGNMDLVYHRRPFLDPDLAAVAMGGLSRSRDGASRRKAGRGAGSPKPGSLGVIALRQGQPTTTLALGDGYPWPARGQRGVPTQFDGLELPLPLPKGVTPMGRGFPITFLFHPDDKVRDAVLQLYEVSNKRQPQAVSGYSFGPGHTIADDGSTYAYAYRNNSGLCHFIAAQPLKAQTWYTARCTYSLGDEKRSVEWSFVTGKGGSHLRY